MARGGAEALKDVVARTQAEDMKTEETGAFLQWVTPWSITKGGPGGVLD